MSAPYQAVKARGRLFVLGANKGRLWERLCNVIGRPDLISRLLASRQFPQAGANPGSDREIEKQLASKPAAEWVELMLAAGVPAAPILNLADALDAITRRRSRWSWSWRIRSKVGEIARLSRQVLRNPPDVRRSRPLLGQQSSEIMREIGIEDAGVEALRQGSVRWPVIATSMVLRQRRTRLRCH